MIRLLPAALAVLGLCMFALSLWFQEGPARGSNQVPSPPPAAEKAQELQESAPAEPLETVPVAMEWSR